MHRKPSIIAYDITSSLKRRRVYRRLLQWRIDGQKSVHECLLSQREAQELYLQLGELIDPETDRLMLVWLSPNGTINGRGTGNTDSLFQRLLHVK